MNDRKHTAAVERGSWKRARSQKAKRKKSFKWTIGIAAIAVVGLILIWATVNGSRQGAVVAGLPGTEYPNQGQKHIAQAESHEPYNSNPPTSGPHLATPANWGVYQEELPDEQLVHNLEHGGVWISYKPGISDEMKKKLEGFAQTYGTKIIITPRSQNDTDIALAVWTRLEKFNVPEYSDERVKNFIEKLRNKTGPEPFAL